MEGLSETKSFLTPLNFTSNNHNNNDFVIEIEIIYKENQFDPSSELPADNTSVSSISNYEEIKSSGIIRYLTLSPKLV
jgi:hypothetical protein